MILSPFHYGVASLLRSERAAAICQAEGERLKKLIWLVRDAGWGVVLAETASNEHYLIVAAPRTRQENLIGDTRSWRRDHGYQFWLKRADERISMPRENAFVLPDGRIVEVRGTRTIAGFFTQWGLSSQMALPPGYTSL